MAKHRRASWETLTRLADSEFEDVRDEALPAVVARIRLTLGIDTENTAAIDHLRGHEWWTMKRNDPAVTVALALSPNA